MKKLLCVYAAVSLVSIFAVSAQNPAVTAALKSKYGSAQWRSECRGWYLVSYNRNGTNFYAFADANGNIIASNAVKYKVHSGYIEMQVFDQLKKDEHDNWERDMRQYQIDYKNYASKKTQYQNELAAYNKNVEAAKKEADNRYKAARQQAYEIAVAKAKQENARLQAQTGGSILGAVLSGIAGGVNIALAGENAANSIQYEPFESKVMAERNLLSPPYEPYNPMPTKPLEPSDGFEWRTFPLLQPCPYTNLDYDAISEPTGFSRALKNGQYWGVVDASLREVIPCVYSNVTSCGNLYSVCKDGKYGLMDLKGKKYAQEKYISISYDNGMFLVNENGKYGLLSQKGDVIMPCRYQKIVPSNGYIMCQENDMWGVFTKDYEELYPCQFQAEEFINTNNKLYLRTKVKGLWGMIDFDSGSKTLPNNFSKIETYNLNGNYVFKVYQGEKQGIYYTNGVLLLPCEFSSLVNFTYAQENYIKVIKDGYAGLYDMNGAVIITPDRYDDFRYMEDFFIVSKGGYRGVCSLYGEELVHPEYSSLDYIAPLYGFLVSKDNKWGIADIRGELAFPMVEASKMEYDPSNPNVFLIRNGYKENGAVNDNGMIVVSPKFKKDQLANKIQAVGKKENFEAIRKAKLETRRRLFEDYQTSQYVEWSHRQTFSFYARNYVERIINDWQRRGEFEKLADWQIRVNENTRQQKVFSLTKEAQENYLLVKAKQMPADYTSIEGRYDPDHETYQVRTKYSDSPIYVHVPTSDAEEFKTTFSELRKKPKFKVKDDGIALEEYSFVMPNGNTYRYQDQESVNYSIAEVNYTFDKIDFKDLNRGLSTTSMKFGTSDVDKNIPSTDKVRDKTFAVIIANECYVNEKDVEFAYNDGMAFRDYCVNAMGIPASNVHFKPNAGLNEMRFEFNWIKKVADDYKGDAEFIVYYAGHGVPDDASKEAYLLPVDGNGADLESAYKLSRLYNMLGEIPSKETLVLLDACFSGSQRNGEVLASARGIAIRPQISKPTGNVVVFSAVTDKETAFPYKEKVHGLFTYYLLKKMQDTPGELNLGTLSEYVTDEVARKSIVVNSKPQHPTIDASAKFVDWKNMIIK